MFNVDEFVKFTNIMGNSSISFKKGFFVIRFNEHLESVSYFESLIMKYGVTLIHEKSENEFVISTDFSDDSILFLSMDKLWIKAGSIGKVPENYFILKENESSVSPSINILTMSLYLKWKKIVESVSNHSINNKCILYMPNDDGGKELIITLSERLDYVHDINYKIDSTLAADNLLKILDIVDVQSNERESIIRTAIFDLLKDKENKTLSTIIDMGDKIYSRYQNLLELYMKRFSVNKILSELEQKQLEYTTKINDFVSSSQSKAFAIPGALIAIGGLAKASGFWDSVLIFIGLYLIYKVTYMSNKVLLDSYDSLSGNLSDLISRYSKFDEGLEVKQAVSNIAIDIKSKIKNAKGFIDKINKMGKIMLWIGGFYLSIKWILFLADYFKLYTILLPR